MHIRKKQKTWLEVLPENTTAGITNKWQKVWEKNKENVLNMFRKICPKVAH